jgi:hypothetical protein
MISKRFLATMICLLPAALGSAVARAETDSGVVSAYPWSGYWWPHNGGGLTGPLSKYDQLLGTGAAGWEQQRVSPNAPSWFGYCHAWSASAVLEREPQQPRTVGQVSFGVGDQKGLLAACHAQDVANSYGDRYGDGQGSEDAQDLSPDELWRILQLYIKQNKIPLVMDLEPGEEVWNYPVYQYEVEYQNRGDGWCDAVLTLVAADDDVEPDYVGTKESVHQYTFRFRFENGAVAIGSGQWTGDSVGDHPDFAWYPYVAVAENPEIDVAQVGNIVGYAVGGGNTPPEGNGGPIAINPPGTNVPPPDNGAPNTPPAPPADTQDVLTVDELLGAVLNKTSAFMLDVFVDKADGGRYQPGEPIRISLRTGQDGYLYLFDVDPKGGLSLVFPLAGQANKILKDKLYVIPGPGYQPWFFAQGVGQHDLRAIMTTKPIQITGFGELPRPSQGGKVKPGQQAGKVKPGSQQGDQTKPGPQQGKVKPQKMFVHPAAMKRLREQLLGARKGDGSSKAAPEKLGAFAQDACLYFVLGAPSAGR